MFEKKRGKRFLASVMAFVMLLSLAPVGALAATTNTFEATAYTDQLTAKDKNGASSANEKTKAYAMWKGADGNYYLAIASKTGKNKVDADFKKEVTDKFSNPASYIENNQGLTVKLDGNIKINGLIPSDAAKDQSDIWVILVMTKDELNDTLHYNNSNGTFNLGIDAQGFDLGDITINDDAFKGTVNEDVNPQPKPDPNSTDVYVYFQTQNTKGEPVDISGTSITYNDHSWATLGKISTTQTLTSDTEYTGTNNILAAVGKQAKTDLNGEALHSNNKDIAAKVLSSITWVLLKEWNGADGYQPAKVKCWHLDGKLTVYGVTYLPGVEDKTEVTNMPENTQTYYLKGTTYTVSSDVPQRTGYTFAGWQSSADSTVYKTGSDMQFTMPDKDVTLTAVWEQKETPGTPTEPTKAVDAKYFVLLPGRGTPASGKDQGTSYYLPNKTSDGGVSGKNDDTGYPGGLTAEGKNAADQNYNYSDDQNGVFNSAGVPNNYLVVPDDLGFFTASNWKNGQYNRDTNTTNPSTVLGETFNVNNVQIIWYAIKSQGDGYHVDGYVAGIPVTLTYHDNFTGSSESYTQNGLKSGETASIAQNGTVSGSETFSHEGYEFGGWYDNAACTGTNYAGQTHTMMDNLNLYAKWEKNDYNYTVKFYKDAVSEANYISGADQTKGAAFGTALSALNVDTTIANGKCPAGYNPQGIIDTDSSLTTVAIENNVVSVVLSKRNDLSYTVNYLEKGSNKELHTPTTVPNKTFNDTVNVSKEVKAIAIDGYNYDSADKETLTIGTSENVINLYYTKATQYKIIIHYVDDAQTPNKLQKDTVIEGKYENNSYDVNEEIPARIGDYVKESVTGDDVKGTVGKSDVIITVVYTKDVLVDSTVPKTDSPGDNIPDKYQVTINYVDDNTGRGKITGLTTEVKTIRDESNNPVKTGKVKASGSTAEATGSKNYFSNWTDKTGKQVDTNATLKARTIENAEGGTTYTFTANFYHRSGGGSSRPSTPTVTIPDDVPTGLNGKDHYAYIIGYGNNDVRPQNNITRAEVATIFFRLLTDETREANMTKSNGYNDVKDGDWFCCAVSTLSKMGIIKGYEDGSFKPDQKITRAETMTLVNRVLNRLPETKDDLHKDMKTWVDNMDETAWYYLAVQEATNSHYFKNKTGTKFEQWTDLRDTRDWSELEK